MSVEGKRRLAMLRRALPTPVKPFRLKEGMEITVNGSVYKVKRARPNGTCVLKFMRIKKEAKE